MKDPQNSRVIIFSNFRGSVRDIMNALVNIGDFVKATQFVGQSSGKTLKGQSQKVQQAVLEKFRAGGYNVIVATSIGEEGLDIMEVDLVICFDANISPLRMIQRMGRTGRKHDGRVDILLLFVNLPIPFVCSSRLRASYLQYDERVFNFAGTSKGKKGGHSMDPHSCSSAQSNNGESPMSSIPEEEEKMVMDSSACVRNVLASVTEEIQAPSLNKKFKSTIGSISAFPIVEDFKTPLANSTTNSCSKDWCLDSGSKSESVKQEKKFKRLRKYGDQGKQRPLDGDIGPAVKSTLACGSQRPILVKNDRGRRKPVKDARDFIEVEAEVSSEVEVSDDEEVEPDTNSYDDSFIDDRMNPTQASTQPETNGTDMMAIYRRSLLTQSPMERLPNGCTDFSPASVASKTRMSDSGSSSGMVHHSLQTPQIGSQSVGRISNSFLLKSKQISTEEMPCTTSGIPRDNESRIGGLKRKLSFYQVGSVPAINLDQDLLSHSEAACRETSLQDQKLKHDPNGDMLDDDQFYDGLDLDAVEEEAAKILGYKSELSVQKKAVIPAPNPPLLRVMGSPTFDLGI